MEGDEPMSHALQRVSVTVAAKSEFRAGGSESALSSCRGLLLTACKNGKMTAFPFYLPIVTRKLELLPVLHRLAELTKSRAQTSTPPQRGQLELGSRL